mmetsp:Transcript_16697/g.26673  ORF Transcript_16697/g.26673 Transcript_16697/m.26673 type:complete len:221 (-) Transcript_16697:306-968(-)
MRTGKKKKTLLFSSTAAAVLVVVVVLAVGSLLVSSESSSFFSSSPVAAATQHSSKLFIRRSNRAISTAADCRWFARNRAARNLKTKTVGSSRYLILPRPAVSGIGGGMDTTPNSQSALERIKAAKTYQRKVKQENDEGNTLSPEDDEAILEIERRDEGDESGSQFNNIKAALDNLKTLDERGHKNDLKAYELLKKLGIPTPKPFVDDSELEFPSEDINPQ